VGSQINRQRGVDATGKVGVVRFAPYINHRNSGRAPRVGLVFQTIPDGALYGGAGACYRRFDILVNLNHT